MMPLGMKTYLALLWGVSVSNGMTSDTNFNANAEPRTPADIIAASPAGTSVQPEQAIATTSAGAAPRPLHATTDPASASVAGVAMSSQEPSSTAKLFKQTVGAPSASAAPPTATGRTSAASVFDPTKSVTPNTVTKTSTSQFPPTARSSTVSFTTASPISTAKAFITTTTTITTTGNVQTSASVSATTTGNISNTANVPTITTVSTTTTTANVSITTTTTTANVSTTTTTNVSTTANVSTSSAGILLPRVPKEMPVPTTKSTPVSTFSPGEVSKSRPTTKVPPCSTQRVIKHFLIAIAFLALLATVFIFSTIVLCTKLSSRKRNLRKPQPATEMMCISALLPERTVAYSRQRNPVTNGVLVIHGDADSDEDGGDNLTLSSFLPENDRYV